MFAVGRNHPTVREGPSVVLEPNVVQMGVSALSGILAERPYHPSLPHYAITLDSGLDSPLPRHFKMETLPDALRLSPSCFDQLSMRLSANWGNAGLGQMKVAAY